MQEKGQHTFHEITSQPEIWLHALNAFSAKQANFLTMMESNRGSQVIVTGCGSTHYLSMTGARLLSQSGLDAQAYPASELWLYPDSVYLPDTDYLLIAVSRSGTTTETVRAVQAFQAQNRGQVIAVTCDSTSTLAELADFTIAIDEAQEESVAQTRSFSSMGVVLQQMAGAIAEMDLFSAKQLPEICQILLSNYANLAQALGENDKIKKFFFLGSDALYGIACEAMLKMKEMSLSYSEAFHMLEFRHGPMSMVANDSLVVGLISSNSSTEDIKVLQEMEQKGATILAIGQADTGFSHQIQLPADLAAWTTPILYLPILQLMGYHRALFNGQNPDQPHNLTAVISLD